MAVVTRGTAFVFHFRRAMHDANIPDTEVDRLYLMISIASVVSRVGGGYLLDRTSEKVVMCVTPLRSGCVNPWMSWPSSVADLGHSVGSAFL